MEKIILRCFAGYIYNATTLRLQFDAHNFYAGTLFCGICELAVIVLSYFVFLKFARNLSQIVIFIVCGLAATGELMVAIFGQTGALLKYIFLNRKLSL